MKAIKAKLVTVLKGRPKHPIKKPSKTDPTDPGNFFIIDEGSGTGTFQVTGMDDSTPPEPVDISSIATLTVESSDPNIIVDSVSGMTAELSVAPNAGNGVAPVKFTATANDGSWSYTFDANVTYTGTKITGIQVTQVTASPKSP